MSQRYLSTKTTAVPYSKPAVVQSNGIEIVYDSFGYSDDPPLLLIMGMGVQNSQRVRTLTSFMSTTGDPTLPRPSLKAAKLLLQGIPSDLCSFAVAQKS